MKSDLQLLREALEDRTVTARAAARAEAVSSEARARANAEIRRADDLHRERFLKSPRSTSPSSQHSTGLFAQR